MGRYGLRMAPRTPHIGTCGYCDTRHRHDRMAVHQASAECAVPQIRAKLLATGLVRLTHTVPWQVWELADYTPARPLTYARAGNLACGFWVEPWVNDYAGLSHGVAITLRAAGLAACMRVPQLLGLLHTCYAIGGHRAVGAKLAGLFHDLPDPDQDWFRRSSSWHWRHTPSVGWEWVNDPKRTGSAWSAATRAYEQAAFATFKQRVLDAHHRAKVEAREQDPNGELPLVTGRQD